jgi:hypothetical protein
VGDHETTVQNPPLLFSTQHRRNVFVRTLGQEHLKGICADFEICLIGNPIDWKSAPQSENCGKSNSRFGGQNQTEIVGMLLYVGFIWNSGAKTTVVGDEALIVWTM